MAKSGRLTGRQYFTDIIGLSLTTVTQLASKAIEFGEEKRKIRAITPLKVIQGHRRRYQSKARICDFILVINSNWHPISYRFGVIATYCSNFGHFAFLSHIFFGGEEGGLRENVWCSSSTNWKARSGLPISVNWTFSHSVTAEALRANIGSKSAISLQRGPVD